MHAISSYRGNRPTNKHTNPHTDRGAYNTLRRSLARSVKNATQSPVSGQLFRTIIDGVASSRVPLELLRIYFAFCTDHMQHTTRIHTGLL